jgi:hypothetical protein
MLNLTEVLTCCLLMKRRETLKRLLLASGALVSLPAWADAWRVEDVAAYGSSFSVTEQGTLAAVADTIIPAGTSIGAISVGVDQFLQKLIDHCYDTDTQQNVKTQLALLEAEAQRLHARAFAGCDQAQRQALLSKLEASGNKAEKDFFTLLKTETIRGFTSSREVMIKYLKYTPVPAHYYGCVDVKA